MPLSGTSVTARIPDFHENDNVTFSYCQDVELRVKGQVAREPHNPSSIGVGIYG